MGHVGGTMLLMLNGFTHRIGLTKHKHPIDHVAALNAIVSGLALYPQVFKVIATRDVSGLEPISFVLFLVSNLVWHAYGWHRRAMPVIVSSACTAIAAAVILTLMYVWT